MSDEVQISEITYECPVGHRLRTLIYLDKVNYHIGHCIQCSPYYAQLERVADLATELVEAEQYLDPAVVLRLALGVNELHQQAADLMEDQ
jgi:hypothetical protein